jgi:hypothetical protein
MLYFCNKAFSSIAQCERFVGIIIGPMPEVEMPADFESIHRLLETGDLDSARDILAGTEPDDEAYTVLRLKLAMMEGSMTPGVTLQKLIQLMRRQAEWPGARALYQEASKLAYAERQSSASHSHVPPPVRTK